ncbi:helix-turn-helix domain-containing protein [Salinifilum ghardaiensis]
MREHRLASGQTQGPVAAAVGVTQQRLSQIEKGRSRSRTSRGASQPGSQHSAGDPGARPARAGGAPRRRCGCRSRGEPGTVACAAELAECLPPRAGGTGGAVVPGGVPGAADTADRPA